MKMEFNRRPKDNLNRLWCFSRRCLATPLALAILLLWQLPAHADSRQEARRHFRHGMSLISSGRLDEGITELKAAYAIKPHPNVLFNIAHACLDAGRSSEAAHYYRRYLETDPPDREAVLAIVTKLDAELAEATSPSPKPEPKPESRSEAKPESKLETAKRLPDEIATQRLDAIIARLEKTLSRTEKAVEEPEPKFLPQAGPPRPPPQELVPFAEDASLPAYEETVVSASKRIQTVMEAPVATTIISEEEIRLSGAQSIPEILRRVPGIDVSTLGVGSVNVSMRGFNQRLSNKVLVLVDGRSVYQDYLGFTHWPTLPVSIEDIDRVEVMRGPGSTLYGANAFMGVANIITKTAGTGSRAAARITGGTGNTLDAALSSSGGDGPVRYRASFGYDQADKWSMDHGIDRTDQIVTAKNPELALREFKANLDVDFAIERSQKLSLSGGLSQGTSEVYPTGMLRNYNYDGTESYLKSDLILGPLQLKSFWTHGHALSGPQYWPPDVASLDCEVTSDVVDTDLQVDHDFDFLGKNRLVAGVGWRMKRTRWTYMSSLALEHHFSAFVQDEWRPFQPLLLVGRYRIDRHPLLNLGSPGFAHSPSGSILFFITPTRVLRASVSTAFRVPTFLESYLDMQFPVPGINAAQVHVFGDRALKPEHIFNTELGYVSELDNVTIDVAVYRSVVTNIIQLSELTRSPASTWNPATGQQVVLNVISENIPATFWAWGAEIGAKASPFAHTDLRFNVALEKVTTDAVEKATNSVTQTPFLKIFGGGSVRLTSSFDVSMDASYVGRTTWLDSNASKTDPTLLYVARLPLAAYVAVNARLAYRLVGDHLEMALVGTNLAAAHKEHPFGNLIERRVFVSLGGTL